jgi:hypothetical protein
VLFFQIKIHCLRCTWTQPRVHLDFHLSLLLHYFCPCLNEFEFSLFGMLEYCGSIANKKEMIQESFMSLHQKVYLVWNMKSYVFEISFNNLLGFP